MSSHGLWKLSQFKKQFHKFVFKEGMRRETCLFFNVVCILRVMSEMKKWRFHHQHFFPFTFFLSYFQLSFFSSLLTLHPFPLKKPFSWNSHETLEIFSEPNSLHFSWARSSVQVNNRSTQRVWGRHSPKQRPKCLFLVSFRALLIDKGGNSNTIN